MKGEYQLTKTVTPTLYTFMVKKISLLAEQKYKKRTLERNDF